MPELVDYLRLDGDEREAIHDWLRLHGLDPRTIPLDGIVGFDEKTGEWVIEQHKQRPGGGSYLGSDGEVAKRRLRRVGKAPLPWRTQ